MNGNIKNYANQLLAYQYQLFQKKFENYKEKPTYNIEGDESTIEHDGNLFSVDKIIFLTKDRKTNTFDIKELDWIFKFDKGDNRKYKNKSTNKDIIITFSDKENKWVVLDGIHRLFELKKSGETKVEVKIIKEFELFFCVKL